jgi:L-ascorbate metabolism protein UlaG (beta-lactamase superfamily)
MSWRTVTDYLKRNDRALQLASVLGRGRGRMRFFDHLNAPRPCALAPDLTDWDNRELAAIWVGHATVLLRIGGMTVLTDPVLGNRVGIGFGLATAGPRRMTLPALSISQLPRIDLMLISHAHFDHLDRPTLCRLSKNIPVVTAHHTLDLLRDLGYRKITELQWGESIRVNSLTVTAREVRHWGARTFYDSHRGFNAYLIESPGHRVLYGGDTAYHELFNDLRKIDLAVLGIGAYDPYVAAHATPEQALAMANHMRAERILPMHHSTFQLSHEPMAEPMERLLTACGHDTDRIVIREVGGLWTGDR